VKNAGRERQLALLRAHPDLAPRKMVADNMTDNSKKEQANYIQNQFIVHLFHLSFSQQPAFPTSLPRKWTNSLR
jgi:hypothetical protein